MHFTHPAGLEAVQPVLFVGDSTAVPKPFNYPQLCGATAQFVFNLFLYKWLVLVLLRGFCEKLGMRTKKASTKLLTITSQPATDPWIDNEVRGCCFKDVRLAKRFSKLLGMMSDGIGESIPYACQDWANTKAAYRFFSNDNVSEDQ